MKNKSSFIEARSKNHHGQHNVLHSRRLNNARQQAPVDEIDKGNVGGDLADHLEAAADDWLLEDQNHDRGTATRNMEDDHDAHEADEADEADEEERNMTLMQAFHRYPKAAAWSLLVSTTLVMEGYDTALLNSLFALPTFLERFGTRLGNGTYEISSRWQVGLNMCVLCGEIIGLQATGFLVEMLGNRYTMILAMALLSCYIFILYHCDSLAMIAVGQILSAMPWGCFQSLAVTYASEVCPLALRYYLTTFSNMCWLFGQIFAACIMKYSQMNLSNSDFGYKLPFALQWIWPVPLAIGIYFAPESPWWLVKHNMLTEAEKSLNRILSCDDKERALQVHLTLEQIKLTIENERLAKQESGSFLDCFKGVNGRRTRITCLTWVAQNSSGAVLLGYSTYFFEKAGLATNKAFTLSIIQYCLGLAGTICSWIISSYYGRWTILAGGLTFQMVTLLVIGGLGFFSGTAASNACGCLLLALSFFYNAGIGAVVYCIVSEMPSAELRTQTIILARNSYNLVGIFNAIMTPYMLNEGDWNWGAKTGLYWGGITALTLAWVCTDLPETSGRTFNDLNELFASGVSAREFKNTIVERYHERGRTSNIDDEFEAFADNAEAREQKRRNFKPMDLG